MRGLYYSPIDLKMILQASIFVSDLLLQMFKSAEDVFTIVIANDYFQLSAWPVIALIVQSQALRINLIISFACQENFFAVLTAKGIQCEAMKLAQP